jgi:hypothetical protein
MKLTRPIRRKLVAGGIAGMLVAGGAAAASGQVTGAPAGTTGTTGTTEPSERNPFESYEPPTGPEQPLAAVEQIAYAQALAAGEANPSDVTIEKGPLSEVLHKLNPSYSTTEPPTAGMARVLASDVYLVTMHGHFTLTRVPVPVGTGVPTGSVLNLTINAHTGVVEGYALPLPGQQQGATTQVARVASVRHIATGAVVGKAVLSGGPAGAGGPGGHLTILLVSSSHHVVARTRTSTRGRFRVVATPGTYSVEIHPKGNTVCGRKTVIVRSHGATHVSLLCSVP